MHFRTGLFHYVAVFWVCLSSWSDVNGSDVHRTVISKMKVMLFNTVSCHSLNVMIQSGSIQYHFMR